MPPERDRLGQGFYTAWMQVYSCFHRVAYKRGQELSHQSFPMFSGMHKGYAMFFSSYRAQRATILRGRQTSAR
jgi:hypothetical protein